MAVADFAAQVPWYASAEFWGGTVVIGILCGIISSGMFLLILSRLKPHVLISEDICKYPSDGKFKFKFVNKSNFKAEDVYFHVYLVTEYTTGDNMKDRKRELVFSSKYTIMEIQAKQKGNPTNPHAVRVPIDTDVERLLDSPFKSLQLSLSVKHSLSGFRKVFSKTYTRSQIKTGFVFESGDNLRSRIEPGALTPTQATSTTSSPPTQLPSGF